MRMIFENLLNQYSDLLDGKLIYIYAEKESMKLLYQDLIDADILFYYDEKETNADNIITNDIVRITSKNKEFSRYNKNIKHRRFAPTYKSKSHKYNYNNLFVYKHYDFIIFNYNYLLRKKKIDKLVELSK